MPIIPPEEYDISYFDGMLSSYTHNAGYSRYQKWYVKDFTLFPDGDSAGEFFADIGKRMLAFMANKTVLEIGCAKGYIVEWLRDNGIEAWGIDVSPYAIGEARPDIQQYLTVANALDYVPALGKNDFNIIFSRWTLSCFTDDQLINTLVPAMNNAGFLQCHIVWPEINPLYYNAHTIDWWLNSAGFKNKTVIINNDDIANYYQV